MQQEEKYGEENSRIDLLLTNSDKPDSPTKKCYVEIKTVTLLESGVNEKPGKAFAKGAGFFPDAVSTRGQKHIRELVTMVEQGHLSQVDCMVCDKTPPPSIKKIIDENNITFVKA